MIGIYGDIVFEVNSRQILTISDYKRQTKHKYSFHEIINQKPITESVGNELEEISFSIKLMKAAGIEPKVELEKLRLMCREHRTNYLIIGNEVIGSCLYVLEEVSESEVQWDGAGNEAVVKVEIKLKEYVTDGDMGGGSSNKYFFWN